MSFQSAPEDVYFLLSPESLFPSMDIFCCSLHHLKDFLYLLMLIDFLHVKEKSTDLLLRIIVKSTQHLYYCELIWRSSAMLWDYYQILYVYLKTDMSYSSIYGIEHHSCPNKWVLMTMNGTNCRHGWLHYSKHGHCIIFQVNPRYSILPP